MPSRRRAARRNSCAVCRRCPRRPADRCGWCGCSCDTSASGSGWQGRRRQPSAWGSGRCPAGTPTGPGPCRRCCRWGCWRRRPSWAVRPPAAWPNWNRHAATTCASWCWPGPGCWGWGSCRCWRPPWRRPDRCGGLRRPFTCWPPTCWRPGSACGRWGSAAGRKPPSPVRRPAWGWRCCARRWNRPRWRSTPPPALWGWGAAVLLGAGLTARQARRWLAAPGVG